MLHQNFIFSLLRNHQNSTRKIVVIVDSLPKEVKCTCQGIQNFFATKKDNNTPIMNKKVKIYKKRMGDGNSKFNMSSITTLCWCFMDIFSCELVLMPRKLFLKTFLSHKNYLLFSIIVSISQISHCSAFPFITKTFVLKTMFLHCTLHFHCSIFQRSSYFPETFI